MRIPPLIPDALLIVIDFVLILWQKVGGIVGHLRLAISFQ